jgi:hypothetical protein
MTLPVYVWRNSVTIKSSGSISMSDISVELGLSGSSNKSLNDSDVRSLLGKSSGAISMSDAYGKSKVVVGSYGGKVNFVNLSYSGYQAYSYESSYYADPDTGYGVATPEPMNYNGSVQIRSLEWHNIYSSPMLVLWLTADVGSSVTIVIDGKPYVLTHFPQDPTVGVYGIVTPAIINDSKTFDIKFVI